MPSFYEFFAGGGMVRAGLGLNWNCLFANDIDPKKASAYTDNWSDRELLVKDVGLLSTTDLVGAPDLAWASFPCQDLSLAGMGAGLKGSRSGTFWPFWQLIRKMRDERRSPALVVLENVCGALTSHKGQDFGSLMKALRLAGYRAGALVIDAALFLPQSRPRLFILGIRDDIGIPQELFSDQPQLPFHNAALREAHRGLATLEQAQWIWWRLPAPKARQSVFADLIEEEASWHTCEQTQMLLNMMSPVNLAKVSAAKKMGRRVVGSVYKRTRIDNKGIKAQRAEVRFDDVAGCLRTPGGGSSRQSILSVHGNEVNSRLLSPREAARLMGLSEKYILPSNDNEAYHLLGDGVAVPVIRHLAHYLFEPLLKNATLSSECAA